MYAPKFPAGTLTESGYAHPHARIRALASNDTAACGQSIDAPLQIATSLRSTAAGRLALHFRPALASCTAPVRLRLRYLVKFHDRSLDHL